MNDVILMNLQRPAHARETKHMTFREGQPCETSVDASEILLRKHKRQLECQRKRREQRRRIDYYPSDKALEVILARTHHGSMGGDYSSIINKLVLATVLERNPK